MSSSTETNSSNSKVESKRFRSSYHDRISNEPLAGGVQDLLEELDEAEKSAKNSKRKQLSETYAARLHPSSSSIDKRRERNLQSKKVCEHARKARGGRLEELNTSVQVKTKTLEFESMKLDNAVMTVEESMMALNNWKYGRH